MSHSAWMIPNQSEKATTARQTGAKKTVRRESGASFAAMMAREQNSADKSTEKTTQRKTETALSTNKSGNIASRQSRPAVARLPESGISLQNPVLAGRTPSDLARMQNFNKARADIGQTRAMNGIIQSGGSSTLDVARNLGAANNLRTIAAAGNGAGFALSSGDFIHTRTNVSRVSKSSSKRRATTEQTGLGKLSAQFESGSDGIAAIGYDSTGGTSYGKYQIASRVGSMKNFLSFLDGEAPDLAKRLRNAGPANTGSRRGAMPDAWRAIAKEQPERFEQLQEAFIHQSHYKPALEAIEQKTGIDTSSLSAAMREVIWSTAVQHGPAGAARIFARADDISGKPQDASYERKMITNVYNLRAGQFGSSSSQVRNAVRNRFRQERQLALNMLDGDAKATLG